MNHRFLPYLIIAFMLLAGCRQKAVLQDLPSNLKPTFSNTDKNPMGTYVAYHGLQTAFTSYDIEVNKKSLRSILKAIRSTTIPEREMCFAYLPGSFIRMRRI